MSPKEQATAAKLLVRWLELCTGSPTEPVKEWAAKLQQLEDDTRLFVAHEDPDA